MFDELVCSTVFVPATPVASASMRNCVGTTTELPTRIGTGHYRITTPDNLDFLRISITARAALAAGTNLVVMVSPSAIASNGGTLFDIFINTDAGAATDTADAVEVTVEKLPLA